MNRFIHAIFILTVVTVVAATFGSCKKSEIPAFDISDSAVYFSSTSNAFSMRGMTEETADLSIELKYIGPVTDYDREVALRIISEGEDAAVVGIDFTVKSSMVPAGALEGRVVLEARKLDDSTPRKSVVLEVVPNENFGVGFKAYASTTVTWSEEYVRPLEDVWKNWYNYFSPYYSRAIHELYIETFGEDIERYVLSPSLPNEENGYIYKSYTWWMSASRTLREKVQQHDRENPDSPLMHSDDCMYYKSYEVAAGAGEVPSRIPTILETLEVL